MGEGIFDLYYSAMVETASLTTGGVIDGSDRIHFIALDISLLRMLTDIYE